MFAQTTCTLPATTADFIVYPTYANLFADDIPFAIDGQNYYFDVSGQVHINNPSSAYVTFQNLTTYAEMPEPATATLVFTDNTHATVSGTFSGAPFNGNFTLNLVKHTPTGYCGRYGCHPYWTQQNSTLTID
jgi:hypothetical protein